MSESLCGQLMIVMRALTHAFTPKGKVPAHLNAAVRALLRSGVPSRSGERVNAHEIGARGSRPAAVNLRCVCRAACNRGTAQHDDPSVVSVGLMDESIPPGALGGCFDEGKRLLAQRALGSRQKWRQAGQFGTTGIVKFRHRASTRDDPLQSICSGRGVAAVTLA